MKIGGTSGLGVLAGEGPLSPSMAEESPPPQPALPAQSSCVRTLGEARSPPRDWNAGGGSSGGLGGDIPSGTGAVMTAAGPRLSCVP